MATFRVDKRSNYSQIANEPLDDERLSLRALGLLCFMLRLPGDWSFTIEWLAKKHKDGKDSVRYCLKELEAAGYITRDQAHDESGKFAGYDYIVRETASPSSASPTTVKPTTDTPTLLSTNIPSTNLTNPPIVPPPGDGSAGKKRRGKKKDTDEEAKAKWNPERFESFWNYYRDIPGENGAKRNENKTAARRAWDRLKPDDMLLRKIAKALKKQLATPEWKRGIGIPMCSTYLNQRRWEGTEHLPEPSEQSGDRDPPKGGHALWS